MYYFASDLHLGLDASTPSGERERRFVNWLDSVGVDAKAIFLVGDIFDFWFEYKRLIPKGFVRVLGKMAELTDKGVEIHFLCGNHDMWCRDYFEKECGVKIHRRPVEVELYGKKLYVDHGHLVPRGSALGSFMNFMFNSRKMKWLFSTLLHPNIMLWFGQCWSGSSRKSKPLTSTFTQESEPLTKFAREMIKTREVDYFIFGHLHCCVDYPLDDKSHLVVLGEWIEGYTYARLGEDGKLELLKFE